MTKQDIAIAACLLFIVGTGGYVYLQLYPLPFMNKEETKGVHIKGASQGSPISNTAPQNNPPGERDDTLYNRLAADTNAQKVLLIDVIGSNTSGIAYVLRENGKMFVSILANMPNAPDNGFYQAWLMKETPRRFYVPLGKLTTYDPGQFVTNTSLDVDYPDFKTVIITLEQHDDRQPERPVMRGKF